MIINTTNLEKLPLYVSLFSLLFLGSSIVYDYGYFWYLGFSFAEAPTTLSDHVRSSLVWLPGILLVTFVVYVFELMMKRVEGGKSEEDLINASPMPKFTFYFRMLPNILLLIVLFALPFILWAIGSRIYLHIYMFPVIITWIVFHKWVFSHPEIIKQTSDHVFIISRWLPVSAISLALLGAASAENDIEKKTNNYQLILTNSIVEVKLLRIFDKYFLVWNADKSNYEFISSSSVSQFKPVQFKTKGKK